MMITIDSYAVAENSKGEISLKMKFIGFDTRDQAIDAIEDIGKSLVEASGQETLK